MTKTSEPVLNDSATGPHGSALQFGGCGCSAPSVDLPVIDTPGDVAPLHLGFIPASSMADCSSVSHCGSGLISSRLRITGSMNGLFSRPSFSLITDRTSTLLSLRFPNIHKPVIHMPAVKNSTYQGL